MFIERVVPPELSTETDLQRSPRIPRQPPEALHLLTAII